MFEIIENPERINVAITRAKKKLIIIGNSMDLKKYDITNKLFEFMKEKNWVENLKDDVLCDYIMAVFK